MILIEIIEILSMFLLAGYKFMPEIGLGEPEFTYSLWGPFTENKERMQKYKETGDSRYIYQNELDKTCFEHGMTNGDFKDLSRRSDSGKVLRDEAFNIAKNPKYGGYQPGLPSMMYDVLDKKCSGGAVTCAQSDLSYVRQIWYQKWKYIKPTVSRGNTQTNYYKIWRVYIILIFLRQYLGCWSSRYVINK